MEYNKFLDDLMERNNYFVKVSKVKNEDVTGIDINYGNEEFDFYAFSIIPDSKHSFVLFRSKEKDEEICIPNFLIRTYIFFHLLKRISQKSLPYNIVKFVDENEKQVNEFTDLIDEPQDKEAEIYINKIITVFVQNKQLNDTIEEELREKGYYHSFSIIKGLLT